MQIEKKSISVIIPMYNSENSIVNVLNGICFQTAKDLILEILVINDGSRDNSFEIANGYANNSDISIRVINKENEGVSSARNRGLKEAKGKWIAFCDADDVWLSNKLEVQRKFVNKRDNVDLVGGNHTPKTLSVLGKKIAKPHKANVKELCIKMFPQTSTILMNKRIYDAIGGFDEKQKYAEDGNYFLKIAYNYNYYYLPEQLVIYDGGKRGFGEKGLSGNMREMYKGNIKNIKDLRKLGYISKTFYFMLFIFYQVKYCRRILIARLSRHNWGVR